MEFSEEDPKKTWNEVVQKEFRDLCRSVEGVTEDLVAWQPAIRSPTHARLYRAFQNDNGTHLRNNVEKIACKNQLGSG